MKYTIFVVETPSDFSARTDPKRAPAFWASYAAYSKALAEAGVSVGGSALQPPATAVTLRVRDGKRHVQDGPFADVKEQLGGYFEIDVPSLEVALEWAARCPAASTGAVEVRPKLEMMKP